ncbi:MAG: hypothetical protein MZV65_49305 [Chromatiales bacterium]|nr:hypothetical protein [Chromatiales bacterium]
MRRAARQAAAHDARRDARLTRTLPPLRRQRASTSREAVLRRAAPADGGRQELPRSPSATARSAGWSCRDQMVGPWQVPVADVAVTASELSTGYHRRGDGHGRAHAAGAARRCRPPARMAVGEALTNLAAARIETLRHVKLLGQLDGGRPAIPARTRAVRHGAGGGHGAVSGAWASPFRSARIRCPMKTVWEEGGERRSDGRALVADRVAPSRRLLDVRSDVDRRSCGLIVATRI